MVSLWIFGERMRERAIKIRTDKKLSESPRNWSLKAWYFNT